VDVPYIEQRFAKQPYIVSTTTGAFAPRPLTPKRAGGWDKADVSYIEQRTAEQRPSTLRKSIYANSSLDGSSTVASCTGPTPRVSKPKKKGGDGWEEVDVSYIEQRTAKQRPATARTNLYASSRLDGSSTVASCTGPTPCFLSSRKKGGDGWEEVDVSYAVHARFRS